MLLWHMGIGAALVYVTLGRQRIDYRAILAGAVAPDIIDGVLGLFLVTSPSGRWIAHTLLAPVVVAIVIVLVTRGKTRLALFGIAVGWLTHLVGDAMWRSPETFLWPLFGTEFSTEPVEPYSWELFTDPLAHVWTWVGELVGLAVLAWFWVAFRLGHEDRWHLFLRDGYLRP